ncbi:GatB/YqeY domain-containing protein [Actomonas aquatica]|uniref:GatB/YqeY domain-containing protein n=1 Tax=Actomonas aquatica TaxID=2866162 RepID=A0ABZ1C9L4_9BACT|nr:GatB/YqeY domain-containing protein [Opitutus sp. WL0086]WRQ88188.1 GatB/YqeY domain-containing protein [Opitutus sp. WL0086]
MPVYETLRSDIIAAMKARDSAKATALRTADAAIQRAAMDTNAEIDDALTVATLRKAVKNLSDANSDFAKAGRTDLVEQNEKEIAILEVYLPSQITGAKLEAIVDAALASTGASSRAQMGQVMGVLKKHEQADLIDFGAASKMVQGKLA